MDENEQLALDLADAQARLKRLARAIERREQAAAKVVELTRSLREARRCLKEATWDVGACLSREREVIAKELKGGPGG